MRIHIHQSTLDPFKLIMIAPCTLPSYVPRCYLAGSGLMRLGSSLMITIHPGGGGQPPLSLEYTPQSVIIIIRARCKEAESAVHQKKSICNQRATQDGSTIVIMIILRLGQELAPSVGRFEPGCVDCPMTVNRPSPTSTQFLWEGGLYVRVPQEVVRFDSLF